MNLDLIKKLIKDSKDTLDFNGLSLIDQDIDLIKQSNLNFSKFKTFFFKGNRLTTQGIVTFIVYLSQLTKKPFL